MRRAIVNVFYSPLKKLSGTYGKKEKKSTKNTVLHTFIQSSINEKDES